MKRIILISVFASIALACAFGQTRYYEHTETVDANGVRTKGSGRGMYITFTSNSCYRSDKDGHGEKIHLLSHDYMNPPWVAVHIYQYKGKQNDWHEFVFDLLKLCENESKQAPSYMGIAIGSSRYSQCMAVVNQHLKNYRYHYYYFNSDYSRMNSKRDGSSNTEVWVRVTPTEDRRPSTPAQFY